jgi:hypothetical protein
MHGASAALDSLRLLNSTRPAGQKEEQRLMATMICFGCGWITELCDCYDSKEFRQELLDLQYAFSEFAYNKPGFSAFIKAEYGWIVNAHEMREAMESYRSFLSQTRFFSGAVGT